MTSRLLLLGLGLAGALLAGGAWGQAAPTQGSVTIFEPAQIARAADLSVADVARPANGSRTATATPASYSVTGLGGESFNLAVPESMTLVRSGGTEEIRLTLTPTRTQGALTGPTDQVSNVRIGIAGALPVSSTAVSGAYQGKYAVTLAYQ
jgi:hypothetical protein